MWVNVTTSDEDSKNGEGDMTMPATEREKEENTDKNTNAKDKDEVKDGDTDKNKDKEKITETKNIIDTNKDRKEDCGEAILQRLWYMLQIGQGNVLLLEFSHWTGTEQSAWTWRKKTKFTDFLAKGDTADIMLA